MSSRSPLSEGTLEFLEPFKSADEPVTLPSGNQISLPKYLLHFKPWSGDAVFNYGNKPLLDFNGEVCFAELAILRMFQQHGWDGAWIETYGGRHFLNSMPKNWKLGSEHIFIPADKEALIDDIQKAGPSHACFDVLVWKGDEILFCEAKRIKKDKLNEPQARFIQGALEFGLPPERLVVIEWVM